MGQSAGRFAQTPLGVILHGSRSGAASNPTAAEYVGTAHWAVANPDSLGWSATIGSDIIALHMPFAAWGWNAREHSSVYLAVELAQAVEAQPISDGQVRAVAWFFQQAKKTWPNLPRFFPTHAELPAGVRDGKTDVFSRGSARTDELRARINAALG